MTTPALTTRPPAVTLTASPPAVGAKPARRPIVIVGDGVTALTLLTVLLLGIPSRMVIGPLGAAGTPAQIFGLLLLIWWIATWIMPTGRLARGAQPIRFALVVFLLAMLASYAAGMMRPIAGDEMTAADRGILSLLAWLGIALVAADGIDSKDRLETLLRRLSVGGAILAAVGIVQFFTGLNVAEMVHLPGLHDNVPFAGLQARSDFTRISGTAIHAIEFGVVLAMIFPISLHYAFRANGRERRWRWLCVVLIGAALPMTVSRSAILGVLVAGLVMFPTWSSSRRFQTLVFVPLFLVAMRAFVPGLIGTVRNLFLSIGADDSTKHRTEGYAMVGHFFGQSPFFGRGISTLLPEHYRILDNQYLGTLVEAGLFGMTALILLFVVGIFTARGARRLSTDPVDRQLAQCLAASVAAAAVTWVTFDAFAFPMATGIMFLILGCVGALWRLQGGRQDWLRSRLQRERPPAVEQRLATKPPLPCADEDRSGSCFHDLRLEPPR